MFANRGMYAEEIINRTISYYSTNSSLLIEKRNVPIKIIKNIDVHTIIGKILNKSTVDYFGYINNKYIEFEAKQTEKEYFSINQIMEHQYQYLQRVSNVALTFVIIYFSKYDEFWLVLFKDIEKYVSINKTKSIKYDDINKFGFKIDLVYPGILNFIEVLNKIFI